jgi:hypothetical protein
MARIIRKTVDAEGNVHADFSGFAEDECVHEDRRLHVDLAQLGLTQVVDSRFKKMGVLPASQKGRHLIPASQPPN